MSDLEALTKKIIKFRNARDWKQFHNLKDVSLSLVLEATEVLEHFQWKDNKEITEYIKYKKNEIGEELADVLYWVLLISYDMNINIKKALEEKLKVNGKRYPIKKSKGNATKYNAL